MQKDIMTFRGDRNIWIDFVAKIKKEKKQIWEVLEKLINKYMKKGEKKVKQEVKQNG